MNMVYFIECNVWRYEEKTCITVYCMILVDSQYIRCVPNQCWASYSENVIKLLIIPFKSNHITVLITLFQK